MQAVGRTGCRPSLRTIYRKPRPAVAQSFHKSGAASNNSLNSNTDWERDIAAGTINVKAQTVGFSEASAIVGHTFPKEDVPIDADNKTVATVVGELPLSPLMDPSFHEARSKFTKTKPSAPPFKFTKFQRHLSRNPYARALATPPRRCPITNVVLPNFFLQRFLLVSHPETGNPWFTPADLGSRAPAASVTGESEDAAAKSSTAEPGLTEEDVDETVSELEEVAASALEAEAFAEEESHRKVQPGQSTAKPAPPAQTSARPGPSTYINSNQQLFRELRIKNSVYFDGFRRLFRMSDHGHSHLTPVLNKANWRDDMDAVLLELMRRRVCEGLLHFAEMVETADRKYIVKCERWTDIKDLQHRGCVLFLGPPAGAASSESDSVNVPPRLSTVDLGPSVRFGTVLTVHNLPVLLGEEHVARLREGSELLRDGSLYLLGRAATVNLQMLLWKLQGYMAWNDAQDTSSAEESE